MEAMAIPTHLEHLHLSKALSANNLSTLDLGVWSRDPLAFETCPFMALGCYRECVLITFGVAQVEPLPDLPGLTIVSDFRDTFNLFDQMPVAYTVQWV